jgi:broad specificity phosphatase PhoE
MKELYLMRHGITWENKAHIFIGQNDPSLIDEAIVEINAIRPHILKPDLIYSSDLKRASETAKSLFPNEKITFLSQLRERHWGNLQGKPRSILEEMNEYQHTSEDDLYRNAGAETLQSMTSRIKYVLNIIKNKTVKSILIVSHGTYLSYFVNILLSEKFNRRPLNNLHYHKILFDNQGNIKDIVFNQNWLKKEKMIK